MRETWSVDEQITKPFLNATQRPDVIITEKGRNPVVIGVKMDGDTPNFTSKGQAEAHFGMLLDPSVFLGEPVASGVYFCTLTAGEFTATRKMLIRK